MVNYNCENEIYFFDDYGEGDYNIVDNISDIVGIINNPKEAMNIATNGFKK